MRQTVCTDSTEKGALACTSAIAVNPFKFQSLWFKCLK